MDEILGDFFDLFVAWFTMFALPLLFFSILLAELC